MSKVEGKVEISEQESQRSRNRGRSTIRVCGRLREGKKGKGLIGEEKERVYKEEIRKRLLGNERKEVAWRGEGNVLLGAGKENGYYSKIRKEDGLRRERRGCW